MGGSEHSGIPDLSTVPFQIHLLHQRSLQLDGRDGALRQFRQLRQAAHLVDGRLHGLTQRSRQNKNVVRVAVDSRVIAGSIGGGIPQGNGQHRVIRSCGRQAHIRGIQSVHRQVLRHIQRLLGLEGLQNRQNGLYVGIVQREVRLTVPGPDAVLIQGEGQRCGAIAVRQGHIFTLGCLRDVRRGNGVLILGSLGRPVADAQHDEHRSAQHRQNDAQNRDQSFFFPAHESLLIVVSRRFSAKFHIVTEYYTTHPPVGQAEPVSSETWFSAKISKIQICPLDNSPFCVIVLVA